MSLTEKINQTTVYLKTIIKEQPEIGLILGSGLGTLSEEIINPKIMPYNTIPHFPLSTVEGHAGELFAGEIEGRKVIAMKGRFHYYEGYSMKEVAYPIRVMLALGIRTFIITNAAGGINVGYSPGDLMIIEDHINFTFNNPLIGTNEDDIGVRFPDMSRAYDPDLIQLAENASKNTGVNIQKGVYIYFAGPSYETPAEIRMARILGADAVGMSTVPEVTAAVHGGGRVLGISCISNMAAGILDQPLNHEEVMETSHMAKNKFINLVKEILRNIS